MLVTNSGMEIFITERITKDIQRRTHKKRRINKKWLKRYGYKCVPDNDKIILSNNKLFMTKGAYERLKSGKEWRKNEFTRALYKRDTQRRGRIW